MSAAGWRVTLLGRGGSRPVKFQIGGARVRLLKVTLRKRPHELRSLRWRDPRAYASLERAQDRDDRWRALANEAVARRGLQQSQQSDRLAFAQRVRAALARRLTTTISSFVSTRVHKTEAAAAARREMTGARDRLSTAAWQRLRGTRSWRQLDPSLWDFEFAYGPVIDQLKPDLIHANDFRMLGVGARAKARAANQGRTIKLVWDAHEFLPGIKPWDPHPRWLPAQIAYEREFAQYADAVVTVSQELAELLQEAHHLPELPTVVLNCPELGPAAPSRDEHDAAEPDRAPSIRAACGLGADVPLIVYSGGAAPQRGLETLVEALPALPGAHVALVLPVQSSPHIDQLRERAEHLGAAERLHVLPYVSHDEVPIFLASADIGAIPIHHYPNHELALITKYFEYAHAGLPMVVSDVRAMASATRQYGIGEVFVAEDTADFVAAVQRVLAAPQSYRDAYRPEMLTEWSWQRQAQRLDSVYRRVLGAPAQGPVT